MEASAKNTEEPLCDVFATQGILVVLTGILICSLHLLKPDFCSALLHRWQEIAANSPQPAELAEQVTKWFASVFSV